MPANGSRTQQAINANQLISKQFSATINGISPKWNIFNTNN